jgi:hypothetical protein
MEAESVNKFVENSSKSEAATSNSMWLESKSLRSTTITDKRCTAHRITMYINVVSTTGMSLVPTKEQASAVVEVTSGSVNLSHMITS